MKILYVVSCCLLSALCVEASPTNKVEEVGGDVIFPCSFMLAENNNKYFCKDPCSYKDILVQTKGSKNVSQGRYNIHDNQNGVIFVTINNLTKSDSGTYRCGVERLGLDTYTEVYLTVNDASNPRPDVSTYTTLPNLSTTSSTNPTTKSNLSATSQNVFTVFITSDGFYNSTTSREEGITQLVWISVGLVVMVTMLVLTLLLFHRQRKKSNRPRPATVHCNDNTAPSGETDCLYEEIKETAGPTDSLPLVMTSVNPTVNSPSDSTTCPAETSCFHNDTVTIYLTVDQRENVNQIYSTADGQAPVAYCSVKLPQDSSSLSVDSGT